MDNGGNGLLTPEKTVEAEVSGKKGGARLVIICLAVLVLVLLVSLLGLVAAVLNLSRDRAEEPAEPTVTQQQQEEEEEESAAPPALSVSPGSIIFNSGIIGEVNIPAYGDVPVSEYRDASFMYDEAGYKYCYIDGGESLVGIDVSEHQGVIDWEKVAASGVDYAMIRLGYRGYTEGVIKRDAYFTANIKGALDAGLEVGVYFFSQAINVSEALDEARYVVSALEDYEISWPVTFDWEPIDASDVRTAGMKTAVLNDCAAAFCDAVAEAGYTPAVYFNQVYGYFKYDLERISEYELWLAEYNETPGFYYGFQMWQYTDSGRVDGIETPVDLNVGFKNYSDEVENDAA